MNGLLQDLRYAVRQLRKSPHFTAVAVITLALGIGANTAIFSVIDTVLLRPLPFRDPGRLLWLNGKVPQTDEAGVSPADFLDYRAANRSFEGIAAFSQVVMAGPSNLAGDKPEQVITNLASRNFFEILGVRLLLGRDFQSADEQVNKPQVAILGYGVWKRDFGGDRNVIGRTIRLDGQNLQIIGVLSSDLAFLSEAQVWLPTPLLDPLMHLRMGHFLRAVGRLRPGVPMEQAQADLDAIAAQLARQYPDTNKGWSLRQRPLTEILVGPVRPALLLIWAAAGLLLLIACTNLSNLVLTRSVRRLREYAIRTALGATRSRLVWQGLIENTVVALAAGVFGLLAAKWGVDVLRAIAPANVPRLQEAHIDATELSFAFAISLLTGTLLGVLPSLQISRGGFSEGLKESARTSASAAHKKFRSALVVGEIAVSLSLLVGAGLLIKSFWLLIHVNPGFRTQHVLTARLSLNGPRYSDPAHRVGFWQELEGRIAGLPGVEAVGATSELPMTGQHSDGPFHIPGRTYGPSEFDDAYFRQITPGYLPAMSIPLLTGRWLDRHDNANSPGTVLVNQAFVKRFFKGQEVLGKRLEVMGDPQPSREIVGVVGNIRHTALGDPEQPEMYVAYAQYAPPAMNLIVSASSNPEVLAAALRQTVAAIDKEETVSAVRSMDDIVDSSVSQPRFSSLLVGVFAVLALLLAAVGLYGVMAYSVSQRTNEIGIRMALGAKRNDVLKMIVLQGMKLAFAGVAAGLAGSLLFSRLLASLLYQVKPTDPFTIVGVTLVLSGVALLANYIPARRAAKVDPMVALRYE